MSRAVSRLSLPGSGYTTAINTPDMPASAPPPPRRTVSLLDIADAGPHQPRQLNVVFASVGCPHRNIVHQVLPRLAALDDVAVRVLLDRDFGRDEIALASSYGSTQLDVTRPARSVVDCHRWKHESDSERQHLDGGEGRASIIEHEAADLSAWADLLVLAPLDADGIARMLHGHTGSLLLELLRGWDTSKKILLVPGMSAHAWEHPMTKKQLSKIRRKWNWVCVLQPLLWTLADDLRHIASWEAADELVDAVRNRVDLANIGQDVEVAPFQHLLPATTASKPSPKLPPELWTMIFDFTGDWELAQTLHVYSNLPPPSDWKPHMQGPRNYMEALELTILRGNLADFEHFIATHSVPRWLSKLCIRLIMRFSMTPLLAHLEANHKALFWDTFGHTFLPDKASSVFGRTEILEFWRTSPSFLTKEYNTEALDGASKAGFVHVLEWWQHSGLPLKFTETALEQASSVGHLAVLEWWRAQSSYADVEPSAEGSNPAAATTDSSRVVLKPGKSICYATQLGRIDVVRWWVHSGVPFAYEETVAKLASTHNHVALLQLWHALKGGKMIYDNQVLVGATRNSHVRVLEWWRQSGLKVEYKTFDIEEALEDGDEGPRGTAVRRWWARNGLNLGVGTSEWMRTKYLNT